MAEYDLVVRGGTVVTGTDTMRADIGIRAGRIAAIAESLSGSDAVDAGGLLVLPGGVDTHCHIEQLRDGGDADEESFETGSRSCLAGGTTSVVTFSNQFKGRDILTPLADYRRRAARGAMVDYGFHQIITDPTDAVVHERNSADRGGGHPQPESVPHLRPAASRRPAVSARARRRAAHRRAGHCALRELEAIRWRTEALLADGRTAPKYHAWSRPPVIEREATHRAIALAELVDQPIQIFHVSCEEVAEEVARAQARGLKVWAETCPQYFVLTAADMDRPGFEGAKFMCSPAPRDTASSEALWDVVRRGTLDGRRSDHSGWNYEGPRGKRVNGAEASFRDIPNGVPGLAARLPLDVLRGRRRRADRREPFRAAGRHQSGETVRPLSAQGQHRDRCRCRPRAVGPREAGHADQRPDAAGDRLHAVRGQDGHRLAGRHAAARAGGDARRRVQAEPGSGQFLARGPYDMIRPRGVLPDGFDAARSA